MGIPEGTEKLEGRLVASTSRFAGSNSTASLCDLHHMFLWNYTKEFLAQMLHLL